MKPSVFGLMLASLSLIGCGGESLGRDGRLRFRYSGTSDYSTTTGVLASGGARATLQVTGLSDDEGASASCLTSDETVATCAFERSSHPMSNLGGEFYQVPDYYAHLVTGRAGATDVIIRLGDKQLDVIAIHVEDATRIALKATAPLPVLVVDTSYTFAIDRFGADGKALLGEGGVGVTLDDGAQQPFASTLLFTRVGRHPVQFHSGAATLDVPFDVIDSSGVTRLDMSIAGLHDDSIFVEYFIAIVPRVGDRPVLGAAPDCAPDSTTVNWQLPSRDDETLTATAGTAVLSVPKHSTVTLACQFGAKASLQVTAD